MSIIDFWQPEISFIGRARGIFINPLSHTLPRPSPLSTAGPATPLQNRYQSRKLKPPAVSRHFNVFFGRRITEDLMEQLFYFIISSFVPSKTHFFMYCSIKQNSGNVRLLK